MNWAQQGQGTFIYGGNRANDVAELNSLFGGIFFIEFSCHWSLWSERSSSSTTSKFEGYEDRGSLRHPPTGWAWWTRGQTNHQPSCGPSSPSHLCSSTWPLPHHMIRLILKVLESHHSKLSSSDPQRLRCLSHHLPDRLWSPRAIVRFADLRKEAAHSGLFCTKTDCDCFCFSKGD